NASLATLGGPVVTVEEHRRDFRRPVPGYYAGVLGRRLSADEYRRLDRAFHDTYRSGLPGCALAADALDALRTWPGTQSLLSMWFHEELLVEVTRRGLAALLDRVDGLPDTVGRGTKAAYLQAHLAALALPGVEAVLTG